MEAYHNPKKKDSKPLHRAGFVGIVGEPNAGKSTLFNHLLGQKLSIITHKAQTTRHRIQGFYSDEHTQIVFLDTPGIIQPAYLLQERMMEQVRRLRGDADLLLHLVDGTRPPGPKDLVYETLEELKLPALLVVNKIDVMTPDAVVSAKDAGMKSYSYSGAVTISARDGTGLEDLMNRIRESMPENPPFFPKEQLSDHPVRFFVSELIREQIYLLYEQEVPYSCAVTIADFKEESERDRIHAEIIVGRNSQKGILIGKKGSRLKELGIRSRKAIEAFTGRKTHLELFVKVREKWRERDLYLKSYGYR